jgi:hypothetical protein
LLIKRENTGRRLIFPGLFVQNQRGRGTVLWLGAGAPHQAGCNGAGDTAFWLSNV